MKRKLFAGIFLLTVAALLFIYRGQARVWITEYIKQRQLPLAQTYDNGENAHGKVAKLEVLHNELPEEFNLAVPFTSQAPFEIWDELHKEACEETALIMLDAFYNNKALTKQSAENEIQKLVKWEIKKFGYFENTTALEAEQILQEYFGYANTRVVNNPTIMDIKQAIFLGNPVILPVAGRLLGNRYFRTPGPIYHMLIVRGWTKDGMIITNDPGTKRGEGYLYKPEILMNAVHDWNGGDVNNGKKVMIVAVEN